MAEGAPGQGGSSGRARYRVVLYFLLGLLAVDAAVVALRRVWRRYDPDEYRERLVGCQRQHCDLIVVGGSPVCEGIDPARLADLPWRGVTLRRAYNFGLPGATTSEVWHAVEHGVTAPPRLLVYGITATDLNDGRDEKEGPRSLMTPGDLPTWARYRGRAAEWCVRQYLEGRLARLWNLHYYRNGIRLWAADQTERLRPGTCPGAAAEARDGLRFSAALRSGTGYAPRPYFQDARLDVRRAAGSLPPFTYLNRFHLGGHLAYLHRLLDWAGGRGVAVVLVDMPVSADLEQLYPREFVAYRAALADVERSRGVRVLRAGREAVGLMDADFADLIHLNSSGAARLSIWLRGALLE